MMGVYMFYSWYVYKAWLGVKWFELRRFLSGLVDK